MGDENNARGKLLNWFMAISTALLVAAVAGLWRMSAEVASMSATMREWSKTFDRVERRVGKIEDMHKTGQHSGADRRLNTLERMHEPGSPHHDGR